MIVKEIKLKKEKNENNASKYWKYIFKIVHRSKEKYNLQSELHL